MKRFLLCTIWTAAFVWSDSLASGGHHHHRHCCCPNYCWPAPTPACPQQRQTGQTASAAKLKVLGRGTFTTPRGRTYEYVDVEDDSTFHDNVRPPSARAIPPTAAAATRATGDDFEGTDRAAAKTTPVNAPAEQFGELQQLLQGLRPDREMRSYNPPITEEPDSPRVAEEQRTVTVDAYLYAAEEEKDNDFHLLLGNGPDETSGASMMNAEISGLPADEPQRSALEIPRKQFRDFFGSTPPRNRYRKLQQPIKVRITGSLFYDIDHAPGAVGTGDWKPDRSWEIHPVTNIEFEP
jgi:hypothetical protein